MIIKYVVLTKSNEFQNISFKVSKTNKVKNKYHDQVGSVLLIERKKGFFKKNFVFFVFYSELRNAASVSYFVRLFDIVSVNKGLRGIAL